MNAPLINSIKTQTKTLFRNARIMLETCNLEFILGGMPIWKHAYHTLHSCDRWFINPCDYAEPCFHVPGLNSLDVESNAENALSREDLLRYLETISVKITDYLNSLTDEMLYEIPRDCDINRLTLIIAQHRHFCAHLGNINATTIIETGKYPRVFGLDDDDNDAGGNFYG